MCLKGRNGKTKRGPTTKEGPDEIDYTLESLESKGSMKINAYFEDDKIQIDPMWTPRPGIAFALWESGPTTAEYKITNKSDKFAAFMAYHDTLQPKNPDAPLFIMDPPTGMIPMGESRTVKITYAGGKEKPAGKHYLRLYIALTEKNELPGDYVTNEQKPKEYFGEGFMEVHFATGISLKEPPPAGVVVEPADRIAFKCTGVGKPARAPIKITNNTTRNIAYKVLRTDPMEYCIRGGRAGLIEAGKFKNLSAKYTNKNTNKPAANTVYLIFFVFVDGTTLPEEFDKRRIDGMPLIFDGVKVLFIDVTREGVFEEATAGPLSVTGGTTAGGTEAGPGGPVTTVAA